MGKTHIEQEVLEQQVKDAEVVVIVGATYQHYKGADKLYKVLGVGVTEADNTSCVIYQAQYGKQLTFLSPVTSWLDTVDYNGETVPRFKKIDNNDEFIRKEFPKDAVYDSWLKIIDNI